MKIVADENIAEIENYFAKAGELVLMPGREINKEVVQDADVLLVRSVTKVDKNLLHNSICKFVGTATSGIDHIDTKWLAQRNIGLGWARGCNANSVVEYIFSSLASLSERNGRDWRRFSFGIVGCGAIGNLLATKLLAMQCKLKIFDPYLDIKHPLAAYFSEYADLLEQDVLTFHTPLTREGHWPTYHMLNAKMLSKLSPKTLLINAARGAVVDNTALLAHLKIYSEQLVVLDAWEGEPQINQDLLQRIAISTPHIAGYSNAGKLNGTKIVHEKFLQFFGLEHGNIFDNGSIEKCILLKVEKYTSASSQLNQLILQAYDVIQDHIAMQALGHAQNAPKLFDDLRKSYPVRREFNSFEISRSGIAENVSDQLLALGFNLQD